MNLNNMLLQGASVSLAKFRILWPPTIDKPPSSPFAWAHLNVCSDRASENICADHALSYGFMENTKLNMHTDWDLCHSTTLSSSTAIKRANLWRHHVS